MTSALLEENQNVLLVFLHYDDFIINWTYCNSDSR